MASVQNATVYDDTFIADAIEILELDPKTQVVVTYSPLDMSQQQSAVSGFCMAYGGMRYTIFMRKRLTRVLAYQTILHELTHIKQEQEGKLVFKSFKEIEWEGKSYTRGDMEQNDMPHEDDANRRTTELKKELKKLRK